MTNHDDNEDNNGEGGGISRRHALECMIWAGTGVLWTISGGVPTSLNLLGAAQAAEAMATGFTFLQISDSHIGFDKAANPHAIDTLKEAMGKIQAMPQKPSFMIHTGDITHLSKAAQFDNAAQIIGGAGWYSFDQNGVHFIALVNVVNLKAGGLGNLGPEQLAWLADDLKALGASTPIVVFAHIPLWAVYPQWGWGTDDAAQALALLKGFGSVTVLNGHIHQIMQKVEGNVTFHTARSTAFPQPAPGTAASPGPMTVPAGQLRGLLGITSVAVKQGKEELAIIDSTLADV